MSRMLGISCDPHNAYLAIVENGSVLECGDDNERLSIPAGEPSEALHTLLEDTAGRIRALRIKSVSILLPEEVTPVMRRRERSMNERAVLETVMRLAAVRAGVPVEITPRATVRARLKCPRTGGLESHIGTVIPMSLGRYWAKGRGLAALAAIALERK
jgi:hypothetical protein